ncbi:hypothetical protein E0Z10_g5625 [Xylaria hypoxylon]|uniref:Uncharacterized protein n=1 Tax=Xylaria hypoxylon TaxID=37992 RepID=A0A4Z0YGI0_9PEZI|nr:hypothetical protein E0Z10_g5625 [Xylaria hypoxylon]
MPLAPAVTKDGFFFVGDLYVEASGHNRHRRAGISELKEHFKSGSHKDHPAHWFEAQLIHYGLRPSKAKSVARMRLFDAVNSGKIAVPWHIQKIEADLKKEWSKNEREAKKAVKHTGSTFTASSKTTSKKRKADSSNVDTNIDAGGINIIVSVNNASTSSSSAKKAKTSTTATASSKAVKGSPKPKNKPAAKPTSKSASKPAPRPVSKSATKSAKKQTARRGGVSQGPSQGSTSTTKKATDRPNPTKQTAQQSGAFVARGRIPTGTFDSNNNFDEPPPPYREYDDYDDNGPYDDGYRSSYSGYSGYSDYSGHSDRSDDSDGY